MTDTTTTDDAVADDVAAEVEPAADATPDLAAQEQQAAKARNREALETRLLIPLLLPILAMIAVALWALNVSRVFLAGDSTSALVIASILTMAILCGGALFSATPKARTSSLAMVIDARARDRRVGRPARARPEPRHRRRGRLHAARATHGRPRRDASTSRRSRRIRFDQASTTAPAGCVEFDISGAAGHSFQFRTLDYKGFPIGTSSPFPKSGKVELKPGVYNVYCTVDGHAAQGMVATVTVAERPLRPHDLPSHGSRLRGRGGDGDAPRGLRRGRRRQRRRLQGAEGRVDRDDHHRRRELLLQA